MRDSHPEELIETSRCNNCPVCGGDSALLYSSLNDRAFHAPGEWSFVRCLNEACRLIWLDPMPAEKDIGKAYKEFYTHTLELVPDTPEHRLRLLLRHSYLQARLGYSQGVGPHWYRHLAAISYVLALLRPAGLAEIESKVAYLRAPEQGMRLLEIGCGSGAQLADLKNYGWDVVGLDTDPRAVKVARERGLDVLQGELGKQDLAENSFDAILMRHVIEHVHDPVSLLRRCGGILRPDGKVVIQTPNTDSWGHRRFGVNWYALEPPRHLMIFAHPSLTRAAEKAGLVIERVASTVLGAPFIWRQSVEIRRSRRADLTQPPGVLCKTGGALIQLVERAMIAFHPWTGEELLLIAQKPKR